MIAGAESAGVTWLTICTIALADGIEAGEERRCLHGQILFVQCTLDLTREVFRHVVGDVADEGVQAWVGCGSIGHGETLTGVEPPSVVKVADGAGWRTKAEKLTGRKGLADLAIPTHRPPWQAVGAFSLLRPRSQHPVACSFIRDANPDQGNLPRRGDHRFVRTRKSVRKVASTRWWQGGGPFCAPAHWPHGPEAIAKRI